jgi:hypothetical protein
MDSIGSTDNWSLLAKRPEWALKLRVNGRPAELSPEDTLRQLTDTARLGTRALWLGHNITAANAQWIMARARQMGLATYGEFVATPYEVGVEAGVDVLVHMGRYELGVIPDELQRPLVDDSEGTAAATAYDYTERVPPTEPHLHDYASFLAAHHAALMPTFSVYYAQLPQHRNLWKEPVAALLDPARIYQPTNRETGEMDYPLSSWTRHLPAMGQRYLEEGQRKKADQSVLRLWHINETLFSANPHYLAAPVRRCRVLCPASPCTPSWNCWSAWDFLRARRWPPPPTTTASSSTGTNWARSPLDAGQILWLSTATPHRTSGTHAVSLVSSWTAM